MNRYRECIRINVLLLKKYWHKALPVTILLLLTMILLILYSPFYHQKVLVDFASPITGQITMFYDNNGVIDLLPQHSRTIALNNEVMASFDFPFSFRKIGIKTDSGFTVNDIERITIDGVIFDRYALKPNPGNLAVLELPAQELSYGARLPFILALASALFFFLKLIRHRPGNYQQVLYHSAVLTGKIVIFWGLVFIFASFNLKFIGSFLDQSWEYGMDLAVLNRMRIGTDIIFTFGPYASIFSRTYHPGFVDFPLMCKIFLGLSYAVLFCLYARQSNIYQQFLFLALLLLMKGEPNTLLYSYPLLWGLYIFKNTYAYGNDCARNKSLDSAAPWICLLSVPLGMLILVKGTLIGLCGGIAATVLVYFLYLKKYRMAAAIAVIPTVSCLFFWVLSGQKLLDLPYFFINSIPIISGYTAAMSVGADNIEVKQWLFILISLMFIWSIIKMRIRNAEKIFISIFLLIFLFLSFKGGFVRHGGYISAASLLLTACLYCFVAGKTLGRFILFCSFIFFLYMSGNNFHNLYDSVINQYKSSLQAACNIQAWKNHMLALHNAHKRAIQSEFPIPKLPGTTDQYPFRQGVLFASDNVWNPRPIFQSYSAYTEKLASLNEQHLRGANAPDNILFDLSREETIDFRLPAMEDGCSWPALLDNYHITGNNQFVFLRKNAQLKETSSFRKLLEGEYEVGQIVTLPYFPNGARLYANINIEPTLTGKMEIAISRTDPIYAAFLLNNERQLVFRIVPEIVKSGFFISPLITTKNEFAAFHNNSLHQLNAKIVRGFTLRYDSSQWKPKYRLTVMEYIPQNMNTQ